MICITPWIELIFYFFAAGVPGIIGIMNFLAHFYLSEDTPSSMLGNFLGDFVKGPIEGKFPREIEEGIINHRRVDQFTDRNPIFIQSKKLISASRSRYAGIIVDVAYDHFLCLNWNRFAKEGLRFFIEKAYQNLCNRDVSIPESAERFIDWMIQDDMLGSYASTDGIDRAFRRISKRVSVENNLHSAVEELEKNYDALDGYFLQFFPEIINAFLPLRTSKE